MHSDFQPCLLCTDISPDSLKLLMALCTVDTQRYSKSSQLYIEEHHSEIVPQFVDGVSVASEFN